MPETEHRCEGMPGSRIIGKAVKRWILWTDESRFDGMEINFCPWCRMKLEESELKGEKNAPRKYRT